MTLANNVVLKASLVPIIWSHMLYTEKEVSAKQLKKWPVTVKDGKLPSQHCKERCSVVRSHSNGNL